MYFVFIDEAGYTPNWESRPADQPFYVLAAICFGADSIVNVYQSIREDIARIGVTGTSPLGQGFEIKAKKIATGSGWWQDHHRERNEVRDLMLSSPTRLGGTAFVVVIDKVRHAAQYVSPGDPCELATRFLTERLAIWLNQAEEHAYCVYDFNSRTRELVSGTSAELIRDGAQFVHYSEFYGEFFVNTLKCDRLVEVSHGDSKYSIGLQVADFFASFSYVYFRDDMPKTCEWWSTLEKSLHRANGKLTGVGLKVFP